MASYTEDSRTALAAQDLVQNALNGCNFDRAESFCQLMDKSDTELQGQLAVQRSNLGRYKKEVEERQVDIQHPRVHHEVEEPVHVAFQVRTLLGGEDSVDLAVADLRRVEAPD